MSDNSEYQLTHLFHELAMCEREERTTLLSEFVGTYPQFSRELGEFVAELALDDARENKGK